MLQACATFDGLERVRGRTAMKRSTWCWVALALLAGACGKEGPAAGPQQKVASASRSEDSKLLESSKKTLVQKREELASLREQLAMGAAVGPQIDATSAELTELSDEFSRRLVAYINADPPVQGEPLRPEQLAAIRLKSAEDILIAREHIGFSGDYRKAIDIFQMSLGIDPDNPDLKAELADAQAKRFMTPERFAAVKKGMAEREVVAAVGRPMPANIREFPEKRITAWYYPKNEQGEAAGVYFNDKKIAYSTDFNAKKKAQVEPAGG